ncbi:phosphatase PAP2 family protein [Fibrobacterota bacterium]
MAAIVLMSVIRVSAGWNPLPVLMNGGPDSPYRLSWRTDLTLSASIFALRYLTLKVPSNVTAYTADEIDTRFSRDDVNAIDRPFIGPYHDFNSTISETSNGIIWCLPFGLLLADGPRRDILKIGVMFLQVQFMYPIVTRAINPFFARKRPYFYSSEENMDRRLSAWAQLSFLSGHTNFGFAFAVFFANTYSAYFPESRLKPAVWALSLGLAATTAVFRVAAREHFPTDIAPAIATGTFIGWFVPFVHRKEHKRISLHPYTDLKGRTGFRVETGL